ncbi:MAG: hypothetical protein KAQ98_12560 [Bacteriovoracaceae bacterium]|nr:hypothetical protein [Bacteriovoracaceae bacterium]
MKTKLGILTALVTALLYVGCSSSPFRWIASSKYDRGDQWEYDAGPSKNNDKDSYMDIFAETPNYRGFGQAVIGGKGEKFRWKWGPMWYRGRLGKNQVKVFIIGQEGAQDENVSNRAFTGSTGTKMQKFINHLGINRSYVYMNTFIYTITGQYSLFGDDAKNPKKIEQRKRLLWIAQDKNSVVVKHRHRMFDHVFEKNNDSLALVIGVGTAGKDSTATWANHLAGKRVCSNSKMTRKGGYCSVTKNGKTIYFIGLPHPGAASPRNGGEAALKRLLGSFNDKAQTAIGLVESGKMNMPIDDGAKRADMDDKFKYGNHSIPHADFAFGTNWRMGQWGTSSNRRGSHTIQIFSRGGCYNNKKIVNGRCSEETDWVSYDDPVDMTKKPRKMSSMDVPYESPKSKKGRRNFDPGPGHFAKTLMDFYNDIDWYDMGVNQHESFGPNGFYRGTFDDPEILVIADQFSHDDVFSARALTGEAGQRLQSYLNKLKKKYLIIRTAPVDTLDLSDTQREKIILDKDVIKARNKIISKLNFKKIKHVIALGKYAAKILKPIEIEFGTQHRTEAFEKPKSSWKISIIPRADLPSHTRWWMGTSGDRARKAYYGHGTSKKYSPNYYKAYAPKWASKWKAGDIIKNAPKYPAEHASYKKFLETDLAD